jgi:uncharacterized protein
MAAPAAIAETHSAVVAFIGDRAYKLKKPVDLGFLDFRTREAREAVCHREVELNRRLAPDVYLGVADVTGPDGEVCDHLVVMRRMPPERRLSTLVSQGAPVEGHLHRLAHLLAAFHASADRPPEAAAVAGPDGVLDLWRANGEGLAQAAGGLVDAGRLEQVGRLAQRYVEGRRPLFDLRAGSGRAVDGHGDLLADDVFCLDDGPRVLDCLEFDDHLRHGDVLLDLAFLVMDLERLGRPELGARFLDEYQELSADSWPASLAHHYIAYRASVRAKVAAIRRQQGDESAGRDAVELLSMAERHLDQGRVRMVLVGGLPGSGKSTLARAVGGGLDATVLRTDEIRKEQAGIRSDDRAGAPYGEGLYRPELVERTYEVLLDRARTALSLGESVVVDASWHRERWRAAARRVAAETHADLTELRCTCPGDVAAGRLTHRGRKGLDASDATPEIARAMADDADPWPEAQEVDTTGPKDGSAAQAWAVLR